MPKFWVWTWFTFKLGLCEFLQTRLFKNTNATYVVTALRSDKFFGIYQKVGWHPFGLKPTSWRFEPPKNVCTGWYPSVNILSNQIKAFHVRHGCGLSSRKRPYGHPVSFFSPAPHCWIDSFSIVPSNAKEKYVSLKKPFHHVRCMAANPNLLKTPQKWFVIETRHCLTGVQRCTGHIPCYMVKVVMLRPHFVQTHFFHLALCRQMLPRKKVGLQVVGHYLRRIPSNG